MPSFDFVLYESLPPPSGPDQIPCPLCRHPSEQIPIDPHVWCSVWVFVAATRKCQFKIPIARDLSGTDVQFLVDGFEDAFAVFGFEVVGAEFDTNHNAHILTMQVDQMFEVDRIFNRVSNSRKVVLVCFLCCFGEFIDACVTLEPSREWARRWV